MRPNTNTTVLALVTITIAMVGWFLTTEAALASRVNTLATQQAATQQVTSDTNVQIAQIEQQMTTAQAEIEQLLVAQGIVPHK